MFVTKEIQIGDKNITEVVNHCLDLINIKKRYRAPVIPRICLLGPRGCGRKTQAKKISRTFNLIHVDFEYLLCQEWISETYLGSLLRACRDQVGKNSLLLTAVIHKRILEKDCIEHGWILTGFPNTLEDFQYLDTIDTPPNRIIFIECNINVCRERIINRRMDCYSGSVVNILENSFRTSNKNLKSHPKDKEDLFDSEIKYYCENYEELRKYSGCTSHIVDGSQTKQRVTECLQAIIMRPLPDCEPRTPCNSQMLFDSIDVQLSANAFDVEEQSSSMRCVCAPCKKPEGYHTP